MTIELSARQERVIQDAIRRGRFRSVDEAIDAALATLAAFPEMASRLTPREAADRIRALRTGNVLPEGLSVRDMIEEGRA